MATGTLGTQARDYNVRCTHYLTSGNLVDASGATLNFAQGQSIKIGTIPAGASIVRATMLTSQVSNAGTNLVALGNTSGGAQLVASAANGLATLGPTAMTVVASSATVLLAADTDVWVTN